LAGCRGKWLALIALAVLWEWLLAPLRPGGSWLVLKSLPLLLPLRGVLRGDVKVMQWALLLVLLLRGRRQRACGRRSARRTMAMIQTAIGLVFFASAIVYLRPFKKAARARAGK